MNEKILEALQTLAAKLGVTAEHLWGVLIKQAPIDGTIDFIACVSLVYFNVAFLRLVVRKTLSDDPDWKEGDAIAAWGAVVVLVIISSIIVWRNAVMIIAAFFNPEYWALKQLL